MAIATGESKSRLRPRFHASRTVSALVFLGTFSLVLTKAQPPPSPAGSALTAACALSGQLPEAPFDPELVEFVANPQPFTEPFTNESLSIAARMIARVVGVHPVVFEILDDERRQPGASDTCQMLRIYSVDARLRSVLLELRFGDLVEATLAAMEGGISRMILSKVERIHGEPSVLSRAPRGWRLLEPGGHAGCVPEA